MSDQQQLERNKEVVVTFYNYIINEKDFESARPYMTDDYKQHNPTAKDGPEGLRAWLEVFYKEFPKLKADTKHVIAEGDMVVLHSLGVNGPSPNGTAVVDIFRVRDGKVCEHWDVIQPIPDDALNANSMF